ncbi:MAG TPA: hypothetical protein VH008_04895 [Pseudonocardia sp.]|jgi:hypothetical protein|nr:hypothetical protein [Pseudonocardia sp.]
MSGPAPDRVERWRGELAEFCAAQLAPFKVPRFWTMRPQLPLTASERIAKAALRAELAVDPEVWTYDRVTGAWLGSSAADPDAPRGADPVVPASVELNEETC